MKRWTFILAVMLLIAAAACEKTIREPGEPEHGGVFLHGTPTNPAPQ
jgi:hypothetical protein